jgi:hypothetical protein
MVNKCSLCDSKLSSLSLYHDKFFFADCFQEYCMICRNWNPCVYLFSELIDMSEFENTKKIKPNDTKKNL